MARSSARKASLYLSKLKENLEEDHWLLESINDILNDLDLEFGCPGDDDATT